jgi:hypothetical protein
MSVFSLGTTALKHLAAASTAIHCFALIACSSSDPQTFEEPTNSAPIVNDLSDRDDLGLAQGSGETRTTSRCGVPSGLAGCVGETYASESIPLDIYIMFDQSGSMCTCVDPGESQLCPDPACRETRLDAVRQATEQFLLDPESAGIGVGLGQFGKQPIGQASCAPSDYDTSAVDIGPLPEHASAIMQALNRVEPTGETPTGAAIRGACDYAARHRAGTPGHQVVILLLTDGKPEAPVTCQNGQGSCCPSLSDAAAAAAACNDQNDIKTYVLGIGPLLDNLEQIAIAGGTERAYLVEGGDVSGKVLDALNRIRGDAAIPCQLQLPRPPPGRTLTLSEVNLEYQSSACDSTLFYSVASAAECGTQDGWYYDDPSNPRGIELCPTSCERVTRPGGSLFYSVGCATQVR